jgi:hypothetical protein
MGLKPSMMDVGAVALRVADGGTTKAFDRTKNPVEFVFNPKTPDETKVLSHVIVVNSEDADTLLGMSVLGKIGLTTTRDIYGAILDRRNSLVTRRLRRVKFRGTSQIPRDSIWGYRGESIRIFVGRSYVKSAVIRKTPQFPT